MLPFSLENCSKMMLKINWFVKKPSMGVACSRLWAPPLKRMCAQTYAIFFTVFAGITIKSLPSPRQMSQNQCHFSTCKYSNLVKHAHGFIAPLNEYTYHILFSSTFRLLNSNRISSIGENAFAGLTSIHTL